LNRLREIFPQRKSDPSCNRFEKIMQDSHPTLQPQPVRKDAGIGVAPTVTKAPEEGAKICPQVDGTVKKPEPSPASVLVHDLNNTFATILMSIEMIRAKTAVPDLLELVQVLETSARRGLATAHQVLTLTLTLTRASAPRSAEPGVTPPSASHPTRTEP
jgi:hypothetical protein